jgi:competence protein ComEC
LNNASVVLRLACGETVFLFTGDIEQGAEAALTGLAGALPASVLKVPHHGARGSVFEPFLQAVNPQVAVVSVGGGNPYGHPAPDMLAAYARLGIRVLRTDRDGAVTVVGAAQGVRVSCESGRRFARVRPGSDGESGTEGQNLRRLFRGDAPCAV